MRISCNAHVMFNAIATVRNVALNVLAKCRLAKLCHKCTYGISGKILLPPTENLSVVSFLNTGTPKIIYVCWLV